MVNWKERFKRTWRFDPILGVSLWSRLTTLRLAQFLYLLLNNEKIRQIIDTVTSRIVLILGRFTEVRKATLDGIRDELRPTELLARPVRFR
jgi:hypothetical protein